MTKHDLDPATEVRKMKTLARDLWISERIKLIGQRGGGYARFSDKRSAGYMRIVVDNLLLTGAVWSDIQSGIRSAASDPKAGPWSVFDHALAAMSAREDQYRMNVKLRMEREIDIRHVERVNHGLRSIGDTMSAVLKRTLR